MVQVPPIVSVKAGQSGGAAAGYLQGIVDQFAAEGWEFNSIETIGILEQPGCGCLAAIFGIKAQMRESTSLSSGDNVWDRRRRSRPSPEEKRLDRRVDLGRSSFFGVHRFMRSGLANLTFILLLVRFTVRAVAVPCGPPVVAQSRRASCSTAASSRVRRPRSLHSGPCPPPRTPHRGPAPSPW